MAKALSVEVLGDVAVSRNVNGSGPKTCAFPMSFRLVNGDLLCAYRGGTEKHSWDGVLFTQRSADGGQTWSEPVAVFDGTGLRPRPQSVFNGVVWERRGVAFAMFNTMEVAGSDAYVFSDEGRKAPHHVYISRSPDGGRSWLPPEPRTLDGAPHDTFVSIPPAVLPSGVVLLPMEATGPNREQYILAAQSADDAATLSPISEWAHDPTGTFSYGDARLTVLPDGRVVFLLWAFVTKSEETLPVHRCESRDGGRTWSAPASVGVASQIMAPLALDDRRMLAISNVRTPPEGSRLWYSEDAGQSWDSTPVMMWDARAERITGRRLSSAGSKADEGGRIWDSLPSFTFGTPQLLPLGNDRFALTYYATVGGVLHIRCCRFNATMPK